MIDEHGKSEFYFCVLSAALFCTVSTDQWHDMFGQLKNTHHLYANSAPRHSVWWCKEGMKVMMMMKQRWKTADDVNFFDMNDPFDVSTFKAPFHGLGFLTSMMMKEPEDRTKIKDYEGSGRWMQQWGWAIKKKSRNHKTIDHFYQALYGPLS